MNIKSVVVAFVFALCVLPARAQLANNNLEVSANFTGNFQAATTGFGITDTATYSGGLLANLRYDFNPLSAIEVNYGYTRFSQFYSPSQVGPQTNVQEATLAYVFSFGAHREGRIKPFLEAGTGALFFSPTANGGNGQLMQDRAVLLYGAGVNYKVTPRVAVRLGYRGLLYRAPDFETAFETTNAVTQMSEPYLGVVFRF